jgi:hypothetical protein
MVRMIRSFRMKNRRVAIGLTGLLLVTPLAAAVGQTSPGAKPGDKEMTCDAVAKEQAQINKDIEKQFKRKQAGKKVGGGLLGFAKNFASSAIVPKVGGLAGSGVVGGAVGRAATQSMGSAIYDAGRTTGNTQASGPQATPEQQARLDRLGKIATYRQCPAG